jgi:CDP-paratose 2-epimerase
MAAAAMKMLVTGSNGLIGSEAVEYFAGQGHIVHGIDNNMPADFFGLGGDTSWRQLQLQALRNFQHHAIDIQEMIRRDVIETASPTASPEIGGAARAVARRRSRR